MSLVYIPLSDSGQQISIDGLSDSVYICTRGQCACLDVYFMWACASGYVHTYASISV